MRVPFLDLAPVHAGMREELDAAYGRVLEASWFVLGQELTAFEAEFATACGAAHAVGVGNGLDALTLVLRAWGIGPGDEVIVPSHTFIATWLAVSQVGATPVPVEVDAATFNLDPARVEASLTPRTKALLPVHLYGLPADMAPLLALADSRGLRVLEDAAQAHGARLHGRSVGSLGHAAAFSFYPGKNLGALGDGGAVVTDDADLAAAVSQLRNYGSPSKYVHDTPGVNSRLDELQAAFLRAKLARLPGWNARRQAIASRYLEALRPTPGLTLPHVPAGHEPVWHLFVVRHADREALRSRLAASGVETGIHYPVPPHRSGAYADLGLAEGALPVAERLAAEVLSLPIGPHLSDEQVEHVCVSVNAALAG